MRFLVPQFIDVEDKIFGPLTLKQAIYVGGGAGVVLALFTRFGFFWTFVIGGPVVALAFALAFIKINNRPFYLVVYAAFFYFLGNKLYLWKQVQEKKKAQQHVEAEVAPTGPTVTQMSIKELARSLDTANTLYTDDTAKKKDHAQ